MTGFLGKMEVDIGDFVQWCPICGENRSKVMVIKDGNAGFGKCLKCGFTCKVQLKGIS